MTKLWRLGSTSFWSKNHSLISPPPPLKRWFYHCRGSWYLSACWFLEPFCLTLPWLSRKFLVFFTKTVHSFEHRTRNPSCFINDIQMVIWSHTLRPMVSIFFYTCPFNVCLRNFVPTTNVTWLFLSFSIKVSSVTSHFLFHHRRPFNSIPPLFPLPPNSVNSQTTTLAGHFLISFLPTLKRTPYVVFK